MSYRIFKVCISIDNNIENFYTKFDTKRSNRFFHMKQRVFIRNPSVNVPNLKVYWIDADNDEILISCEEDFAVYLEDEKASKLHFTVNNNVQNEVQQEESIPMESEVVETQHKCKKCHKDEEKRCRRVEKLSKKLRHYEEACKNEEGRSRSKHSEKREYKNNERLERARRRVEQIRSIISSIDPANLNSSNTNTEINAGASTSSTTTNEASQNADLPFSPETVRLLSTAISNCLQPCHIINKVLNEVYAIIPTVMDQANEVMTSVDQQDQQQQTEVPKNTTATNTSNTNTPLLNNNSNQEIEELFKEAAKELEKMNEIVNNNKMESSTSSSLTGITQVERVFNNLNDSAISDATIVDMNNYRNSSDQLDSSMILKAVDEEVFKISTPPKSMRSRESSIEVHDVSSVMSDDSRDWTMLSQDELSIEPVPMPRNVDQKTGAIPKTSQQSVDVEIQTNESKDDSIKSVSIETQTPPSLLGDMSQQQLQESVKKSIDIVQKSIENITKSIETVNVQKPENAQAEVVEQKDKEVPVEQPKATPEASMKRDIYPNLRPSAPVMPETSQANLNAARVSQNNKPQARFEPAVIVYDTNPKINASVHTMMNMGFSNEDNWLTQLLINVDGDIAKALNFLTPQPKNRKP